MSWMKISWEMQSFWWLIGCFYHLCLGRDELRGYVWIKTSLFTMKMAFFVVLGVCLDVLSGFYIFIIKVYTLHVLLLGWGDFGEVLGGMFMIDVVMNLACFSRMGELRVHACTFVEAFDMAWLFEAYLWNLIRYNFLSAWGIWEVQLFSKLSEGRLRRMMT